MNLPDLLDSLAASWLEMSQRTDPDVSLKTLGVRVSDNSKLFERADMKVGTYMKVLEYLADPANWPAAMVPPVACAILSQLGRPVPRANRMPALVAA